MKRPKRELGNLVMAASVMVPQVLADDATRETVLNFFRTLPLALEQDGIQVIHVYRDQAMIDIASSATCSVTLYEQYKQIIDNDHASGGEWDSVERPLEHQNRKSGQAAHFWPGKATCHSD